MVSLLTGLLYASLQLPLDNRKNKNSRNVCLSQIREKNIFPRKFLLIQYNTAQCLLGWCKCKIFVMYVFKSTEYAQKISTHIQGVLKKIVHVNQAILPIYNPNLLQMFTQSSRLQI